MRFYSTNDPSHRVSAREAIFRGLPADRGLYMPERIDPLPDGFFQELPNLSFAEIGYRISRQLLGAEIPERDLRAIVEETLSFPAPVVTLDDATYVLELFHGPSLAFKDFGARFMSRTMAYYDRDTTDRKLVILVATSGDTGGAVAAGFYDTPGIEVVILYPSGKVSMLQEKQLTTLGKNVHALEIDGSFDDCQSLVKEAFLDPVLSEKLRLSSANSINIARLIPQTFYYFEAFKQLPVGGSVVFCVPSGNFGNLTAGLLARKLGLPVAHFIAATNRNDVVPEYLREGTYRPRPSIPTLSNAMDVGAPSNFARMANLFGHLEGLEVPDPEVHRRMSELITGSAYTDEQTETAVKELEARYGYIMDPHGAVGYLALRDWQRSNPGTRGVILETAHPSKFLPDMQRILGRAIEVPERLARLRALPKQAVKLKPEYGDFRAWLQNQHFE